MSILSRIISPHVHYHTDFGFGIKVRQWHPDWFVPVLKIQLEYWFSTYKRYKSQQKAITEINSILSEDWKMKDKLAEIEAVVQLVDCGFECSYTKPYGFVSEAGCPIHDI